MALFKIATDLTFERTVRVRVPSSKNAFTTQEFTAVFRMMPDDEMEAATKLIPYLRAGVTPDPDEAEGLPPAEPVDEAAAKSPLQGLQYELLRRVWVGWSGVADPSGDGTKPWAWSGEAREQMLRFAYVRNAVMAAYGDAVEGKKYVKGN